MMHFIAFLETAEDGDGILHAWLFDHDWLEASLEGGVLFDVFAIFVERRGADGVQFAASELWFEHIGSVCRAFGCAGAHNGMELVDKEDDLALEAVTSLRNAFSLSSNSPRNLAPAIMAPMSIAMTRLFLSDSGTSPATMRRASPRRWPSCRRPAR